VLYKLDTPVIATVGEHIAMGIVGTEDIKGITGQGLNAMSTGMRQYGYGSGPGWL
jgi:hypothetical protein